MAAATKAIPIVNLGPEGETWHVPVAATIIYKGTMVAINAAGYAVAAGLAAANGKVIGVADHDVDNSAGAAGDKKLRIQTRKTFVFNNGAGADEITLATLAIGANCFCADDNTIADNDATATRVVAGTFMGLEETSGKPRVYIQPQA